MALSSEDVLRLNVLLANRPQAIRIDESTMTVHGLTDVGEATVRLHPTCRHEQYLRWVREALSTRVLDSPGGYPVFLKRWTRMGQIRTEGLEALLLLGEPEAVAAVAHAPGLSDELARRAWWAAPRPEHARQMLEREAVAKGRMGSVLAQHLIEHLAFEDDPQVMIDTVRQLLRPGLIDAQARLAIWGKGRRRNAYRVGFLLASPDVFPETLPPRADLPRYAAALRASAAGGNPIARQLERVLSGVGQTFVSTAMAVLEKPFNQDVVNALLDAVAQYLNEVRPGGEREASIETLLADAERLCGREAAGTPELQAALRELPALRQEIRALLVLSRLGYPVVRPVFSRTSAIGTLMRKKLLPITTPIFAQLNTLRGVYQ